jgi:hypothetical protein
VDAGADEDILASSRPIDLIELFFFAYATS